MQVEDLHCTYPAAISWTQSSSILSLSFEFVSIGSSSAFWMHSHSPGELLLCTLWHVDEFFLSAITLSLARQCYANYSPSHDSRLFIAGNFVSLDIVWFQEAGKIYLCQGAFIDHLLEQDNANRIA
jgi:hypothetical protein